MCEVLGGEVILEISPYFIYKSSTKLCYNTFKISYIKINTLWYLHDECWNENGRNRFKESSGVKDYLTPASDGKNYNVTYYALPMVLAVGFRVRSIRKNRIKNAWRNWKSN